MTSGHHDLFSLDGHVAVVTGASSGLGRRAASILSDAGASVIGVARRAAALESWVAEGEGRRAALPADLSDEAGVVAMCDAASGLFGPPDILVHAAGVNLRQPAENVTPQDWQLTQWLNLGAPFFISQKLVPA